MKPYFKIENGDKFYYKDKELTILHREDGPAIERANGTKSWWLNGKLHREDGAAVEYADGTKAWWLNGERHRVDGPAIEYVDGDKFWYLNGNRYTEEDFNAIAKPKTDKEVIAALKEQLAAALKENEQLRK